MTWPNIFRTGLFLIIAIILWMLLIFQFRYLVPQTIHVLNRTGVDFPPLLPFLSSNVTEGRIVVLATATLILGVIARRFWTRSTLLVALPFFANILIHLAIYQADSKLVHVLLKSSL